MADEGDRLTTDGDARREAFRRLTTGSLTRSYRLAAAILGDPEEAQDAVHDAIVRGWTQWASLRSEDRFEAWFDRIVVNSCRDRLRRRRSRRTDIVPDLADEILIRDIDQIDVLRACLRSLTPEHRLVVVLRYMDDLSTAEIAARTGVRDGTVRSRLHYALRALRAAYEAYERDTDQR